MPKNRCGTCGRFRAPEVLRIYNSGDSEVVQCKWCMSQYDRETYFPPGSDEIRKADCHPERKYNARGLCLPCYRNFLYQKSNEKVKARAKDWYYNNIDRRKGNYRAWFQKNKWLINAHGAKRHASKLLATPPWITKDQLNHIKKMYEECPPGFHVDHIIPLQGRNVRGLHVPWNIQILPAKENLSKGNRIK